MRRLALALTLLTSLTVSLPGCTLAGAGIGTIVGGVRASNHPDEHISISHDTRIGMAIGAIADALALGYLVYRFPGPIFSSGPTL